MVIICQIDDQSLSTEFCTKEMSTLLDFLYRVESEKVLNPVSIREIHITEGLKTQNYAPSHCPQLGRRYAVETKDVADEVYHGKCQPQS